MMENHSSCSYKQEKEVLKLDSMPLAMTYVPWQKWMKFQVPLFLIWFIVACIFLLTAQHIGYGPF